MNTTVQTKAAPPKASAPNENLMDDDEASAHVLPNIDDEAPPSRIVDEEDYDHDDPLFTMTCGLLPASMCFDFIPEDFAELSANAPVDLPAGRRGTHTLSPEEYLWH